MTKLNMGDITYNDVTYGNNKCNISYMVFIYYPN
jgi:hypothetical protein